MFGHRRRHGAAWATALIIFSGPGHDHDLAAELQQRGVHVTVVDTLVGGRAHDVLRGGLGEALCARVARGDFDFVFVATPCASYSIAHRPQLRSRRQQSGLRNVPPQWARYVDKHNSLAIFTARIIRAAHEAGSAWAIENPADRGDRQSKAWWPQHADHAPLWVQPSIATAIRETGGSLRTFAQCAFGSPFQKWTSIAHSHNMTEQLEPLDQMHCPHGRAPHEARARGLAPDGTSMTAISAAYPNAMNAFIAEAVAVWARTALHLTAQRSAIGGRVADGPALGRDVAAACVAAAHAPPKFASLRNRRPADPLQLRREPLPGELHQTPYHTRPTPLPSRPHPTSPPSPPADQPADGAGRAARIAAGPIAIHELFLDGVYEHDVQSWLELVDAAIADVRTGAVPKAVPTRVIGQHQLQPWARGVVWDCRDPAHCLPVTRSDRSTVFQGARQIDRAALRAIAADLRWHDRDIVEQAGEGGLEARSQCPLDMVLSFHHLGLREHVGIADKIVRADWGEQWADKPIRHPPFVPMRAIPRNIVMQERTRLVPQSDGSPDVLETYDKGRITTNLSAMGELSPNFNVPDTERTTWMPSVQDHARGLAIVDTAGGADHRAQSYVVDAESAFRFCPMQRADLWMQCFVWWDEHGNAGYCVDHRLVFGGAFAPNRFQRVSSLVAAHIKSRQAAFDSSRPLPPAGARWSAERRDLQERGLLDSATTQLHPSHLQVFIDDFSGSALDDVVRPDPDLDAITIEPKYTTIIGGIPAVAGTRVHYHALIAVSGLSDFRFFAAPSKVTAGDPIIILGFTVHRARRHVRCPEVKRATLLSHLEVHRQQAVDLHVDRRTAARTVGRLCNVSQALPELVQSMHGGYAVAESSWVVRGRRVRPPALRLRSGSAAQTDWIELIDLATTLLSENSGVDIAPERSFPPVGSVGMWTVTTDASGVDGVGGYVFCADEPSTVWIVSEVWPDDIQAALHEAARSDRDLAAGDSASLSMPAAELFGQIAVAHAVALARGVSPDLVTAIGDCDAAACAINAAASGNRQMHALLRQLQRVAPHWLAVSVPRTANVDADRLSHPAQLDDVVRDAVASGLTVQHAKIHSSMWQLMRAAAAVGVAPRAPKRSRAAEPTDQ